MHKLVYAARKELLGLTPWPQFVGFFKKKIQNWKHVIIMSPVWTRIYDVRTIPYYDIQLPLVSVGHVVTGSVLQQNVVFSEFTHKSGKCWNIRSYRE